MSCYRCYRCYRSIHWSDMFSSNLCTDLFQSQLRSFLRPCWGHIEVIFHEMNQPAIWGSPIFPDLSIKFLMSRLQRPVQTTAGSDVQSGHLQVAEVRWHRHWDKTPKEHLKKTWFFIDQWLLIYQIYTWLWSTATASFIMCFYHFEYRWLSLRMTFCWVECAATYLTCKADTGMEWVPQIWRGRTHFDPQRLYGLNRMGMWWQTFLPAISRHVQSHICSLSVRCIL